MIIPFDLGLELITFYTIVLCFGINPVVGWIVAIIIILGSHLVTQHICFYMIIKILVYGFICLMVAMFSGLGIQTLGKILIVVRNIIFIIITFFMNPEKGFTYLPSNVLNVVINFYLLSTFAEPILALL
jgi:hypothetical protein